MNEERSDPAVFQFFNEIGIIEQLARTRFERQMPGGLKLPQFIVLNHFVRLGGERSPLSLARAFQVSKGTMTNTLQRLEARGFIRVRPDPDDGRGKLVAITESGTQARNDAIAALLVPLQALEADIPTEEFAAALPFLARVRIWLDEERDRN